MRCSVILKLQDLLGKNEKFRAYVSAWDKEIDFEVKTENGSTWFLFYSEEKILASDAYKKRFSIEKCFQDQKSSGFNIEKTNQEALFYSVFSAIVHGNNWRIHAK